MLKPLIVTSLITLFSVLPARAENWIPINLQSDGSSSYIDIDSIHTKNGYYQSWVFYPDKHQGKKLHYLIACKEKTAKLLMTQSHTSGIQLLTSSNYENDKAMPIAAGTKESHIWEFLCR